MSTKLPQKKLLTISAAFLITLAALQAWNLPRASLADTITPNQIIGPTYRGEFGAFDQFYIAYKFKNTGRIPVEITELQTKVLLNGTDYNSQPVTHSLATVQPGMTGEIIRVVQLSLAPIGYQEGQVWNITVITEITAESSLGPIKHSKTITQTDSIDWEVNLFE